MRGHNYRGEVVFSANYICDYLQTKSFKAKTAIADTIQLLETHNIFAYATNDKYFSIGQVCQPSVTYVKLFDYEIDTIMRCRHKIDKDMMLCVFIYIKSCVNFHSKVAYPSYKTIQFNTLVKANSCLANYLRILQELQLVVCEKTYNGNNQYTILDKCVKM